MKEITKTIYYCDHCNKRYIAQKKRMTRHELMCSANPENKRACYECVFLEEIPTWYYVKNVNGELEAKKAKGFYCKKKEVELYPPILDHKGVEVEEHKQPMPKQCEDFKHWTTSENLPF